MATRQRCCIASSRSNPWARLPVDEMIAKVTQLWQAERRCRDVAPRYRLASSRRMTARKGGEASAALMGRPVARRPRLMFLYWGRRGVMSRFTLELGRAVRGAPIDACDDLGVAAERAVRGLRRACARPVSDRYVSCRLWSGAGGVAHPGPAPAACRTATAGRHRGGRRSHAARVVAAGGTGDHGRRRALHPVDPRCGPASRATRRPG